MTVIKIAYPSTPEGKSKWSKEYGLNAYWAGKHWALRAKDAEYWHTLVRAELARMPGLTMYDYPVTLTFFWNDRLDLSNHAAIAKMIEDGLKGTVIFDDSRKYVKGIEHYWHNNDYIEIWIKGAN